MFFGILKKHFPPESELSKIFNRKKVKLSYSCMPNMKSLISSHNRKMMAKEGEMILPCNCNGGLLKCPLEGGCQTKDLVYKAKVITTENDKKYTFKLGYDIW